MSAETTTASDVETALSLFCTGVRVTELKSKYAMDFHLFGPGKNFASSIELPKGSDVATEVVLRFPYVENTTENQVQMEFELFLAETSPPGVASVRVQPRHAGSYGPHIILRDVPVSAAVAYAKTVARRYRG